MPGMECSEPNGSTDVSQQTKAETLEVVESCQCTDRCQDEQRLEKTDDLSSTSNGEEPQALSKRQRKKLLKYQKWLDTKDERRKREKEKQRQRLEAKRAAGEACGNIRKRLKEVTMAASSCKQRIAIDMSFDDLMIEKHLSQCVKQVSRCYSANRRATNPLQLYVTSFVGKCESVMAKQNGYRNWDVYFKDEYYMDIFAKEDIVYLTSESENVITSLDDGKVYIIGGLVDHNVHKGLCHKLAVEKGISHAKLPIDDYVEMKTRKILTVDHVFQILVGVANGKSWKESFLSFIPARKGAIGKDDLGGEDFSDNKLTHEDKDIKFHEGQEREIAGEKVLIKSNESGGTLVESC
ncbi:tRNA methyltransferase 10 homolog A isoform X1 [Panulirus ornatus]|uniref:tRNA methyltransferase 10 homolog A isoform X1 n=1 Tax=Panulirus ornatus TaxID=150431 RepID=UPI003A842A13